MAETDEPKYGDERDSIRDRAKAAGIPYGRVYAKDKDSDYPALLLLAFSDGTASSTISIDARTARLFSQLKFEGFQIIGPYRSLYDKSDESLEAVLVSNSQQTDLVRTLLKLPGIERVSQENEISPYFEVATETLDIPDVDSIEFMNGPVDVPHLPSWRLPIPGAPNGTTVELSPPSEKLAAFVGTGSPGSPVTIKIRGVRPAEQSILTDQLESIAASILFELDVRFGLSLSLQYRQTSGLERKLGTRKPGDQPIRFPTIRYPKAPTTLYSYAKNAVGNPLQQYLAYYQAIEHYWPTFINRDAIDRVRNTLRHPLFNREADEDIQRLIMQAGRSAGREPRELEQLKTTLAYSIDRQDLEEWLEALLDDVKTLLLEKSILAGVKPLSLAPNDNRRLTDQIAERVYALRCRIVHAKDSDSFAEPLLPYSREAALLRADLLLIEFLCQKVIVAGSNERF